MSQALAIAQTRLLTPTGLSTSDIDHTFSTLLASGADYGDLYFQHSRRESWSMEDGIVKDGAHAIEQGVGVRAINGEKTGFAYSGEIDAAALLAAAGSARAISRDGGAGGAQALTPRPSRQLYASDDPIDAMGNEAKVKALRRVDTLLRSLDPRVQQVMVSLSAAVDTVLVARSDGVLAADVRPLVRMNVQVIVEQNGRRESGYAGFGGRYSYEQLLGDGQPEKFAREALRQALVNLESIDAPAGLMPVVLGNGWTGVLLHEAVGHGLEGDFNRKGTSTYAGRMGQRVASPGVTIVDDATLAGRRGSLNIDDEGTPTQSTTLIEDGVLTGYMQDTLNARLMGMAPTGNGRRESYAHLVMPRMTNTYMLAGQDDPEDMIRSVKRGLYAVNFGGGQVDITSGKYVFSATEAYLIEDGKITAPVKGATLIGNGPETMQRVTMIGHDLALDDGVGVCGKDGQSVPVGVGQPSLKISELTVGGTQA
ncbi:metalloprotease TldD [Solilutibacter tolerans]|uniref:TldD protein n=1 Tax=Solilutibacter tolerans TaxID=1604334 RepID=A0A1N6P205_9GAMM|nr:metalloprotease TldD [Lysobacter tolerans]SIP98380.1 microcin-processing peptidase 2. Unknown type peptidase. MEROPS family U62 [Lysobacter tolerans]